MSKGKNKRSVQRSIRNAIGYSALGLVVVVAVFLMLRGNAPAGVPSLAVENTAIDLGNIQDYTPTIFTIRVTNTGTGPLRFTEQPYIQVLEGCCPPELAIGKMTLQPGESAVVTSSQFMMHPGMDGPHNYAVHLVTNDPAQPDLVVNVLSNWSQ